MNTRTILRQLRGVLTLVLLSVTSSGAAQAPLRRATFIPLWLPQAQFAGYFVAFERGIYRQHGIDLTIQPGGPDHPVSQALRQGSADFGTLWLSTAIRMRAQGTPIVNAAQVVQRSSLMLVAKKASGIERPSDLDGKKVGVWAGDFQLLPLAFFHQYHLNVRIVPQASTVTLFLRDGVSAAVVMWYNEYHTILNSGLDADELTAFFFRDHRLNVPEDGIYCRTTVEWPLCEAFAQASLEGWQYAFAHPDEALDVVLAYMARSHLPASRTHQRWMLARMRDVILPQQSGDVFGTLRRDDFERTAQLLRDNGWIDQAPDYADFYHGAATR